MKRLDDASGQLDWLPDPEGEGPVTGYDAVGWPASTWILHAMYEAPGRVGLGTHDDVHRNAIAAGEIAPTIIEGVDLDGLGTLTGIPLGFVLRPDPPWVRVRWADYLRRFPYRFSPSNIWPVSREWFVSTNADLSATNVGGEPTLVDALRADPRLECIDWQRPVS
ncbi:MAG: hypothetical protein AB7V42_08535 [Thermoleophilia bacterium]